MADAQMFPETAEELRTEGCNPDVTAAITISLEEYRLLISDAQKKAKEEGCKEGREEAWDLARRIVELGEDCYTTTEVDMAFGTGAWDVLRMSVDEALEKDRVYQEDKKKLHAGDEVEFDSMWDALFGSGEEGTMRKGYVIEVDLDDEGEWVRVLLKGDGTRVVKAKACKKTGKHNPDIEKVMASFEEGEKDD